MVPVCESSEEGASVSGQGSHTTSDTSSSERSRALDEIVQWYRNYRGARARVRSFLELHGFHGVCMRSYRTFNTRFWYPLHCAVKQSDPVMVWLLLLTGADPRQLDSAKQTPLQYALHKDKNGSHREVVAVLRYAERLGWGDDSKANLLCTELSMPGGGGSPQQWSSFFRDLSSNAAALSAVCKGKRGEDP